MAQVINRIFGGVRVPDSDMPIRENAEATVQTTSVAPSSVPEQKVTPAEKQPQTQPNAPKAEDTPTFYSIFSSSYKSPERTAEETAKIEKAEKANKIIYGIGDALSAFTNLYSATKGATPAILTPTAKTYSDAMQTYEKDYRKRLDAYKDSGYKSQIMDLKSTIDSNSARAKSQAEAQLLAAKLEAEDTMLQKRLNNDLSKEKIRAALEDNKLKASIDQNKAENGLKARQLAEQERSNKSTEQKDNKPYVFTLGNQTYTIQSAQMESLLPQFDGIMSKVAKLNPDVKSQYDNLFNSILPASNDKTKQEAIRDFKIGVIKQYYHLYPGAVDKIKQLSGQTLPQKPIIKRDANGKIPFKFPK